MPKIYYQYRPATENDRLTARRKIPLYGMLAIGTFIFLLRNPHDPFTTLYGSVCAHSVLMVLDAFDPLSGKCNSAFGPSFLDYLLPIQHAEPTWIMLMDAIALIIIFREIFFLIT